MRILLVEVKKARVINLFKRKKSKPKTIEEQAEDIYNRNPIVFDRLAQL